MSINPNGENPKGTQQFIKSRLVLRGGKGRELMRTLKVE